ncbi:hypothetical protein QBC35DRAFT_476957 [Podospora australis]|uniref:Ecp2 effector protein-like domain-containing protein n=1 Tax=Podospora australis TaxID=1536484 RepID=A0AAN6WMZ9_9PEZI|nr:hypothetical protein QBC35DRAFT_476957 [Podospora australis]
MHFPTLVMAVSAAILTTVSGLPVVPSDPEIYGKSSSGEIFRLFHEPVPGSVPKESVFDKVSGQNVTTLWYSPQTWTPADEGNHTLLTEYLRLAHAQVSENQAIDKRTASCRDGPLWTSTTDTSPLTVDCQHMHDNALDTEGSWGLTKEGGFLKLIQDGTCAFGAYIMGSFDGYQAPMIIYIDSADIKRTIGYAISANNEIQVGEDDKKLLGDFGILYCLAEQPAQTQFWPARWEIVHA